MDVADLDNGAAEAAIQAKIEAIGESMSAQVLCTIAKRLGEIPKGATFVDVYRWLSEDMGRLDELFLRGGRLISESTDDELHQLAETVDKWGAPYYAAKKVKQAACEDNIYLAQILRTAAESMDADISKMVRTRAAMIDTGNGLMPIRQAYLDACTRAVLGTVGGKSTEDVIVDAVEALSKSGVKIVYKSGVRRDLYSAVGLNVRDGYGQAMQDLRDRQAVEFGADGVAISAHAMCAPDHQRIQGRRFKMADFERMQQTMKRPIGKYNCRHHVTKVIMGIGKGAYDAEDRKQLIEASNRKVKFDDGGEKKEMTAYEYTQHQREVETRVRKLRVGAQVATAGGQTELAETYRNKAKALADTYKAQNRQTGIEGMPERMEVYDWNQVY